MKPDSYKVVKVFNNNVVLALDNNNNNEKILFGKGLGFGRHQGDTIQTSEKIDKIFSIADPENKNRFNDLMNIVDNVTIGICEEIISLISHELNEDLNEKIHISLTDHIFFTLKRLKENDEIANPFLIETETLYKDEFRIAQKAVRLLEEKTGIHIPDGEIGFITLHIHSSRNNGKLSNTIKYAYLANSSAELIEDELGIELDRTSLDYARFIIHLRFAIERITNNNPIKNELLTTIKRKYKNSYELSKKIARLIEDSLSIPVVKDEIGYIAIHVERLRNVT